MGHDRQALKSYILDHGVVWWRSLNPHVTAVKTKTTHHDSSAGFMGQTNPGRS